VSPPEDVVVHRCRVQVLRHGGWSWGPDPRHLLDQVLHALRGAIAEYLGAAGGEAGDVVLTEPVRIAVALRAGELLGAGPPGRRPAQAGDVRVLPQPAPAERSLPATVTGLPARPAATPAAGPKPPDPSTTTPVVLLRFLVQALGRGELAELLALLSSATLEAWSAALLPAPPEPAGGPAARTPATGDGDRSPRPAAQPPAAARELLRRLAWLRARGSLAGLLALAPADLLGAWELVAREVLEAATADPGDAELVAALTRARTAAPAEPANRAELLRVRLAGLAELAARVGAAELARVLAPLPVTGGRPAAAAPHAAPAPTEVQVEVASALPFLLLGPLAHAGWVQTVRPALRAAGLAEGDEAALAVALAYTVLDPPERGWRRTPADQTSAAAFAGLDAPLPEPDLVDFARRVPEALPALDGLVAASVARTHAPERPLLLDQTGAADGGGFVLADADGLLPVAWADDLAGLLPPWRACGSPTVLIGPGAAGGPSVEALQAAGVRFVTGVPPTRRERWRRLPRPARLWTNDLELPPALLARQAAGFADMTARLDGLVDALAVAHHAVRLATGQALRRSMTLAAALGLGTIAWMLWRDREATDPLLALERFGDLGATVRFDERRVLVRLPLGRRHRDLFEHGLLADVRGVPWLGGRVLELSGG
jgi:hypothetical protein